MREEEGMRNRGCEGRGGEKGGKIKEVTSAITTESLTEYDNGALLATTSIVRIIGFNFRRWDYFVQSGNS